MLGLIHSPAHLLSGQNRGVGRVTDITFAAVTTIPTLAAYIFILIPKVLGAHTPRHQRNPTEPGEQIDS
jgi:hypothetical protein